MKHTYFYAYRLIQITLEYNSSEGGFYKLKLYSFDLPKIYTIILRRNKFWISKTAYIFINFQLLLKKI